jgi:hypothetical protein
VPSIGLRDLAPEVPASPTIGRTTGASVTVDPDRDGRNGWHGADGLAKIAFADTGDPAVAGFAGERERLRP